MQVLDTGLILTTYRNNIVSYIQYLCYPLIPLLGTERKIINLVSVGRNNKRNRESLLSRAHGISIWPGKMRMDEINANIVSPDKGFNFVEISVSKRG